jgi:hypothetical protein
MNYKIAPEDSTLWKCNWLECAGGSGLAGGGMCSFRGDWSNPNCPYFITEDDLQILWHLDYIKRTAWWRRILQPIPLWWFRFVLWLRMEARR